MSSTYSLSPHGTPIEERVAIWRSIPCYRRLVWNLRHENSESHFKGFQRDDAVYGLGQYIPQSGRSEDHRSHYASAVSSEHSRSLCIIEYKAKHHDIYEIWPGLGKHHLADKFLHIVVTSDDVT